MSVAAIDQASSQALVSRRAPRNYSASVFGSVNNSCLCPFPPLHIYPSVTKQYKELLKYISLHSIMLKYAFVWLHPLLGSTELTSGQVISSNSYGFPFSKVRSGVNISFACSHCMQLTAF